MKCIYCFEDKPSTSYTKVEHVMPQSFGVFRANFTLENRVCDDCNEFFGDNLEIVLARDSVEGTSRFEFGLKRPSEFRHIGNRSRIRIKIAEGEYKGAYAYREYSQKQDRIVIKPAPQVGFLRRTLPEYQYFLLDNIPHKDELENGDFDLKSRRAIRVIGADFDAAREALSRKEIDFQFKGEEERSRGKPMQDIACEITIRIDDAVLRAFAKIAFNYLSYHEPVDFVLHQSFDPMRNFIRYGTHVSYPLVIVDDNPILRDEPVEGKRRLGHIITVNWASDKVSIVSQVSIFNDATYVACLARNFLGERRDIRRGHFFNVNSNEILELSAESPMA
jgi:hypothetical protein